MDNIKTLEYIIASHVLQHPEILDLTNPGDLWDVEGFRAQFAERMPPDHDLTINGAGLALARVKEKFPQNKYIFYVVGERVDQ